MAPTREALAITLLLTTACGGDDAPAGADAAEAATVDAAPAGFVHRVYVERVGTGGVLLADGVEVAPAQVAADRAWYVVERSFASYEAGLAAAPLHLVLQETDGPGAECEVAVGKCEETCAYAPGFDACGSISGLELEEVYRELSPGACAEVADLWCSGPAGEWGYT